MSKGQQDDIRVHMLGSTQHPATAKDIEEAKKYFKSHDDQPPTDTEMLDWLESHARGYGDGWVCRNSGTGRGLRLHETTRTDAKRTVREAIIDAMIKEI